VRYQDAKKIAEEALVLETGVAVMVHILESMKKLKIEI
jgi:hypothetical protein